MGLLDVFNSDEGKLGLSLLAAAAPSMEPMNLAGRFALAGKNLQAMKDNDLKDQLVNAQISNFDSEVAQRKAATEKMTQGLGLLSSVLAPKATYQPGQLGSGTMGILPNAEPLAVSRPTAGLQNATPEQIAMIKAYTGTDLMEPWKVAKEGFERKPNTFYESTDGKMRYMPDPTKGMNYDPASNRVSGIPGFNDFTTQQTLATEAPKTLLNSAATINMRKNPDGTESPVSALSENPTLQGVLSSLFGGRQNLGAPTTATTATPTNSVIPAATQAARDAEAIRIRQEELKNPNLPADHRQAIERDLARLQGRPVYGKTTAQETAEAADKESAILKAKDIGEQRKSIMNAGFVAPSNIARYQKIGQLLQDVDGGRWTPKGTEFASTLNSFGIKIDKNLPNKEAAESLANQAALELRNPAGGAGMPGALSDADRDYLKSMTPNQAQSAQGRKQVIDAYIAVQQRNQQVADFARKYEKKYGKLDNDFFDQLQQWSNANPLFKGK